MKLKTLKRTAHNWKDEIEDRVRGNHDTEEKALIAWQVLGGLCALLALFSMYKMLPELVRYLKIERM